MQISNEEKSFGQLTVENSKFDVLSIAEDKQKTKNNYCVWIALMEARIPTN